MITEPVRAKIYLPRAQTRVTSQSESTNRDRQAMIDDDLQQSTKIKKREDSRLPSRSGLLEMTDANAERRSGRNWTVKVANPWNVDGLPGDRSRKSKFVRLLGGEKSSMEVHDWSIDESFCLFC